MASSVKKKSFYSGHGLGKYDRVLSNYSKGIYFNNITHTSEPIGEKINKYNKEFIIKYNELNQRFFGMILAYSITIFLLDAHKNEVRGIINNLYRLLSAQGGTVRYNKMIKNRLRKYEIRKQEIYDAIKSDVRTEEDRLVRNANLLIETMKETGLNWVLKVIELEEHRDFFESSKCFIDEKQGQAALLSEEQEHEFYQQVKQEYVKYLESLADKYNINPFEEVSGAVLKHLKERREKAMEIDKEMKAKKAEAKKNKAVSYMSKDNADIQRDMLSLAAIADLEMHSNRFSSAQAKRLSSAIYNNKIKRFWYIGICKQTSVYYLGKSIDNEGVTKSITKARWFNSKEEAEMALELAREKMDLSGYIDILHIDTGYVEASKVLSCNTTKTTDESLRNIIRDIGYGLQGTMHTYDVFKKKIAKEVLTTQNNRIIAANDVTAFVKSTPDIYEVLIKYGVKHSLGDISSEYIEIKKFNTNKTVAQFLIDNKLTNFRQVKLDISSWNMQGFAEELNSKAYTLKMYIQHEVEGTNYKKGYEFENYGEASFNEIVYFGNRIKKHKSKEAFFITVVDLNDLKEKFFYKGSIKFVTNSLRLATILYDLNSVEEAINNIRLKYRRYALCMVHEIVA